MLTVGDSFHEDAGGPAGVAGFYIDITEQFKRTCRSGCRKRYRLTERRAVINQAIGMLMLRYAINADSAFKLSTRLSQEFKVKLRIIAERAVADPGTIGRLVDNLPTALRRHGGKLIV